MHEIKQLDEKGRGMAGDLHVQFAYPGDVVEVELLNRRKKTGKLISLIHPSPFRQHPLCPHFGACGGCPWQGLKYEAQLKFKEEKVKALFGECNPIFPSPQIYFYRNRMDYAFGPNFSIGLKTGKDEIINIEKCLFMSEESNKILGRLRHFISLKKLLPYKEGIMRHVVMREGKKIKNSILNILTSEKGLFPLEELWKKMQDLVQGVTWSVNLSPADRSYGDIQKSLGNDFFLEKLGTIHYKIPVQSFFQTNSYQTIHLLETVKNFTDLSGAEKVVDLYCGVGTIGLFLAPHAKFVTGIEEDQEAARAASENAERNGIKNFSAEIGKVEDVIPSFVGKFEVVILDPPRPGVHKKVLKKLGETKPQKIVYVSCNPFTQKHDVDILKEFGYKIEKCQPLDMFPHTPHIENVILLGRSQY